MTNEELKALCERVLADDPKMTVHPVRLADACLRLLRENEVMLEVVEAAKVAYQKFPIQHQPAGWLVDLGKAIAQLESP